MELTWDTSNDNKWYVNPACLAWRITNSSNAEITNSITEKGSWVAIGTPNHPATGWTQHMKSYGIYPVLPADDVVDPYIGVWQVHTSTFTIPTAGDYSLRIESDNYGYMKITDSGGTVLVDREITYANGMGQETFPMTLGPGTYTLETRVQNISRDSNPNTFAYQDTYNSAPNDGPGGDKIGTAEVLAGYGIPNKTAMCGTYEFPKKISYWKVEIDPKALIPHRSLDQAEIEAVVGDDGSVVDVVIINGGRGYTDNAQIHIMNPREMDSFSPTDSADFMEDKLTMDPDYVKALGDVSKEDRSHTLSEMKTAGRKWGTAMQAIVTKD